jgi:hypothetical protein
MNPEKIKVRNTDTGQLVEVVVLNKRAEWIDVVLASRKILWVQALPGAAALALVLAAQH